MDNRLSDAGFLTKWVLSLEEKHKVEEWRINDITIWPYIRIRLHLDIMHHFVGEKDKGHGFPKASKRRTISNYLKQCIRLLMFILKPFARTPIICAGFSAHRLEWRGKLFNRYFDPILDTFEEKRITKKARFVEYDFVGEKKLAFYRNDRVIKLYEFRDLLNKFFSVRFRLAKPRMHLPHFDSFLQELEELSVPDDAFSEAELRKAIGDIEASAWFFGKLFKKTECKVALGLCYYSPSLYGMNLAAFRSGLVSTVDVQHGGQGEFHLAYAQFTRMPLGGFFNLLPNYFWCWDKDSAKTIGNWAKRPSSKHKVFVGGHPWIDYIRTVNHPLPNNDSNIIILTLQPYETLVDSFLLEAIKKTGNTLKWYLRLHPRQSSKRNDLRRLLAENGIDKIAEVDGACDIPLPLLLKHASLHLTKSSGSAIEASLINVPTIILDEWGIGMYKELIESGRAFPFLGRDADALFSLMSAILTDWKRDDSVETTKDWSFILDLSKIVN